MGDVARRYGAVGAVGLLVGLAVWAYVDAGASCGDEDIGCGIGFALSVPVVVLLALPAVWGVLRLLRVARPGVTAACCWGVGLLLMGIAASHSPTPGWLALIGVVSFLIGGMLGG